MTDRQTDGQTDILPQHSPRYAYASCGKNTTLSSQTLLKSTVIINNRHSILRGWDCIRCQHAWQATRVKYTKVKTIAIDYSKTTNGISAHSKNIQDVQNRVITTDSYFSIFNRRWTPSELEIHCVSKMCQGWLAIALTHIHQLQLGHFLRHSVHKKLSLLLPFVLYVFSAIHLKQELSYRKQIARQLRTQFAKGIFVTLKSTLRVTQGHWKRNHWTDHTWLTVRRVIGHWILSWPWNVGQRSLKVIESGSLPLKVWVRFPNFSYPKPNPNPMVRGQDHWKLRRSIDHMRLSIGPPL